MEKALRKVKSHEQSTTHIINFVKWKDLKVALEKQSGIDDQHQSKINEEKQGWRETGSAKSLSL